MSNCSDNQHQIPFWHLVYVVVICLIVCVFLLCIMPGRVNEDAYHNFSFAATITSIVLAVVSIVYSIQSGLVSFNRIESIQDIEGRIGKELERFENLENSIKSAVKEGISPLEASMGDIKQIQGDIQRAQDDLSNNWKSLLLNENSIKSEDEGNKEDVAATSLKQGIPQVFDIILYACSQSKTYQKEIPFDIFIKFFGARSYYCEGVIKCLSIYISDKLQVVKGIKSNQVIVTLYDNAYFGTTEELKNRIRMGNNRKLGNDIIVAMDDYFSSRAESENDRCSV